MRKYLTNPENRGTLAGADGQRKFWTVYEKNLLTREKDVVKSDGKLTSVNFGQTERIRLWQTDDQTESA